MKNHLLLKFIGLSIYLSLTGFLNGCAATDADKVRDAQACLNKSTATTARTCYNKVSGVSSKGASLIRCGALFVEQGYSSPTQLQSVIASLQGQGSNPTATSMTVLAFKASGGTASNATDEANATDAATQCAASGSSGFTMLSSMAKMATSISKISGAGAQNPSDYISVANTNAATLADSTNSAMLADSYAQNCSGGSSGSYSSFCSQYSTALSNSGGSSQTAAQYFFQHLN